MCRGMRLRGNIDTLSCLSITASFIIPLLLTAVLPLAHASPPEVGQSIANEILNGESVVASSAETLNLTKIDGHNTFLKNVVRTYGDI